MISFSSLDILVLIIFFAAVLLVGFISKVGKGKETDEYLLSGRKVGLLLFVLTNVATWYGGILGVGEFTYKYGVVSWVTQGLPYYIFAILFAIFFAEKIREAKLFTIPDKLQQTYGREVGLLSAVIIFLLVSPAPYILMIANLLMLIFNIKLLPAIIIGVIVSSIYLFKGGYKSDLYTDALEFFVMFIGFIIMIYIANSDLGGFDFIKQNVPSNHLTFTGSASVTYIVVWFLIALWTFTDPGFHQRCYAAKSGKIARNGIIISVVLWALFDFLTTATGLYSRAALPNLQNPIQAFPLLAEKLLGPGLKGFFYAALFATILSTLNSFLFLSATTFSRDFIYKIKNGISDRETVIYTKVGLFVTIIISIPLAYYVKSIIRLWYLIGSILIPGIIFLIIGAYYADFKINKNYAIAEIILGVSGSLIWFLLRPYFSDSNILFQIEPMIIGLVLALIVHITGLNRVSSESIL